MPIEPDPSSQTTPDRTRPDARPPWRRRLRPALNALVALLAGLLLVGQLIGAFRQPGVVTVGSPVSGDFDPSVGTNPPASAGGQTEAPVDTTRPPRECEIPTLIGTVVKSEVVARTRPDPAAPVVATFGLKNEFGQPRVFDLLKQVRGSDGGIWYRALLPVRPNETKGYLPAGSVQPNETSYRLKLERERFRLTLYEGCKRMKVFTVGIGTGSTPTPVGKFYLAALIKPPDPNTIYGTYAYGLSAFSETLTNWKYGGIVGLHGTNVPSSVGQESSHGCIRMHNRDIEQLVPILPLGTPIEIT